MRRRAFRMTLLCLAVFSAMALATSTTILVMDYVHAVVNGPAEKATLETLEEEAAADLEKLPALEAERDRQTREAHARVERQELHGMILVIASIIFLATAKYLGSLKDPVPPAFEILRAERGMSTPSLSSSSPEEPAGGGTQSPAQAVGEKPGLASPPPVNLRFVEELVRRVGPGKDGAIPILQAIQSHYRYLPQEALRRLCELTEITPAQVSGVSTFYAQFRRRPVGEHMVRICLGTACHVCHGSEITEEVHRFLDIPADGDTDPAREFTVETVACVGCCSLAPVIVIDDETYGKLTPAAAREAIQRFRRDRRREKSA